MTLDNKKTIEDAPFTYKVDRFGKTYYGDTIYIINVMVDGLFVCEHGFTCSYLNYESVLQRALPVARTKALSQITDMRAEIARMQVIVDKVAGVQS